MEFCERPLWKDPLGLITNFNLKYQPICEYQIINFIVRLLLLGLVVGLIGTPLCGGSAIPICLLLASVIVIFTVITTQQPSPRDRLKQDIAEVQLTPEFVSRQRLPKGSTTTENFSDFVRGPVSRIVGIDAALPFNDAAPYSGPSLPDYTPPAAKNLFMNVLLDEYKYNPDRPPAAPVTDPIVKQAMDDYFRVQWFSDPTDVFGKSQSQRQFVTQPSTSVPNDQKSFQEWLYKIPGKTCKEGGQYCTEQGSAGVQYTWMGL